MTTHFPSICFSEIYSLKERELKNYEPQAEMFIYKEKKSSSINCIDDQISKGAVQKGRHPFRGREGVCRKMTFVHKPI